ncbi:Inner membrane protein yecN [Serratia rubidaea]|uniref:Inner membrane protein yecN n=1 Tax=Serratia rubidaea TaxID=61652 RepID=A0A4U9HHH8_SERRU|nr:Inner membrane protein yecN [Serratia rubidaea]
MADPPQRLLLIAGRLVHFYGLRNREARWRASGMIATYISLVLMVLANTYYLPWELIFTLH